MGYLKSQLDPQQPQNLTKKPQICLTLKNFMRIFCCRAHMSVRLGMSPQSFGYNMMSHGHNMVSIGHKLFFCILEKGRLLLWRPQDLTNSRSGILAMSVPCFTFRYFSCVKTPQLHFHFQMKYHCKSKCF